jgi:hypothetical protein
LLKTPNVTSKPAQSLFQFHKPRERLPILKPRSSLLDFTELQHDYMYALAGCSDVSFVQSKVADDVRETLHNIFGMEKVKIGLWFKNRRPKDSPSTRSTGGARLTAVGGQRSNSSLHEEHDLPVFLEESTQGRDKKRPSTSRPISTPDFGVMPMFTMPSMHQTSVDVLPVFNPRPQSTHSFLMNPTSLYLQQPQQQIVFAEAQRPVFQQASFAIDQHSMGAPQMIHQPASSQLAPFQIQNAQAQMPRPQFEVNVGQDSSAASSLSELLTLVGILSKQGPPNAIMEALVASRAKGLNRASALSPMDFLSDIVVAAASAGASATMGQGSLGGMDFTSLQRLNITPAPLETFRAELQDEQNRQRFAASLGGGPQAPIPCDNMNMSGSGSAAGNTGLNLLFLNKPSSDGNVNLLFPSKPGSDGNGGVSSVQTIQQLLQDNRGKASTLPPGPQSDNSGMSLGALQPPTSAPTLTSDFGAPSRLHHLASITPPYTMAMPQVLNLTQTEPGITGRTMFQSMPQLPPASANDAQQAQYFQLIQAQLQELQQQKH